MNRRAPTIWAAVVALAVAGLLYEESRRPRAEKDPPASDASSKGEEPSESESEPPADIPPDLSAAPVQDATPSRFHTLPDGSPVPALPSNAPDQVKLGIALFRYKGAQGTSDSTRSRESALSLAREAIEIAQKDFAEAVKKGDHGSSENVGWMDQRILERSVEYAVFTLEKGQVSSEPIDTPRGFWVAKRHR